MTGARYAWSAPGGRARLAGLIGQAANPLKTRLLRDFPRGVNLWPGPGVIAGSYRIAAICQHFIQSAYHLASTVHHERGGRISAIP